MGGQVSSLRHLKLECVGATGETVPALPLEEAYEGAERRNERRRLLAIPVLVTPLDTRLHPVGPAVQMVLRDVSPKGLGLLHTASVNSAYLSVHSAGSDRQVLVRRLRSRPVGEYFDIGGEIVTHRDLFRLALTAWRSECDRLEQWSLRLDADLPSDWDG